MSQISTDSPTIPPRFRFQAARIAAGFVEISLVADLLHTSTEEYRTCEAFGDMDPVDWAQLAQLFGVSVDFLATGSIRGHREKLAATIATGLAGCTFSGRALGVALEAARTGAGYGSAGDAATALGISPLLYLAQEAGARPLTAGQVAAYALAFGLRPDHILLAGQATPLWSEQEEPWWRKQDRTDFGATDMAPSPSFQWLRRGNCTGATLTLPVIEFVGEKWTVRRDTFRLPRCMLPATVGPVGTTLYGIVDRFLNGSQIVLVDPTIAGRDSVRATGDGGLSVVKERQATKVVDPTCHRPRTNRVRFCIGSYVATTTVFG